MNIVNEQNICKQYRIVYENGQPVWPEHTEWHDSLKDAIDELNSVLDRDVHQLLQYNDCLNLTDVMSRLRVDLKIGIEERLHINKMHQDKVYSDNELLYQKKIKNINENTEKKIEHSKYDDQHKYSHSDTNCSDTNYSGRNGSYGSFSTDSQGCVTYTTHDGNNIYLGNVSDWKPTYSGETLEDYALRQLNRAMGGW